MATHAHSADATFDQLARELAAGAEVDAELVALTLDRAGRTWGELRAACDEAAARPDEDRAATPATAE